MIARFSAPSFIVDPQKVHLSSQVSISKNKGIVALSTLMSSSSALKALDTHAMYQLHNSQAPPILTKSQEINNDGIR